MIEVSLTVTKMSAPNPYKQFAPGTQPNCLHGPYVSSARRAPTKPPIHIPQTLSEVTGPTWAPEKIAEVSCDLTKQHRGTPIGPRIVVSGRVLDEDARPIPHTLIEIWQANAAGRYLHALDQGSAPLDPNFTGEGRLFTDAQGRYRFLTIRPGEYAWKNHYNAWRPAHIHFSIFGPAFATRLVTQMYFSGDPLLALDPIFNCTTDEAARHRLVSQFDLNTTIPGESLGYHFDIVLRGRHSTPFEDSHHD
jgi:protocatechuate 3,4-dioxygenase beta subunit